MRLNSGGPNAIRWKHEGTINPTVLPWQTIMISDKHSLKVTNIQAGDKWLHILPTLSSLTHIKAKHAHTVCTNEGSLAHNWSPPFMTTLQSKKCVHTAHQYSTSFFTPLSPPTQLLAATLCTHLCQCHCHCCAPHAPTLLLTFPLTERGPWSFSCWLFWNIAVERVKALLSHSMRFPWIWPVRQYTATGFYSPNLLF